MRDFESSNQICVTPTALPIILMLSPGLPACAKYVPRLRRWCGGDIERVGQRFRYGFDAAEPEDVACYAC